MLEYFKTILSKVSFSKYLFEKELRKAIKVLVAEELRGTAKLVLPQVWTIPVNYSQKFYISGYFTSVKQD